MRQDVSSDIVFTQETLDCLNRIRGLLVLLRSKAEAGTCGVIDRTFSDLDEIQPAIEAQMEVNANA